MVFLYGGAEARAPIHIDAFRNTLGSYSPGVLDHSKMISREIPKDKIITGKVTDDKANPLPGVGVTQRGTGKGTVTNTDGSYSLTVSGDDAVLVFSYMGFDTQEIPVGGRTVIDVKMQSDNRVLNEVVVVGFGTQKKVNLTGAVGTVSGKQLENRPVINALQSLQGIVPGLNITQSNGAFNTPPSIDIRGTGSISSASSAAPLVLIDGMDGSLTALNPADIDNISVLKDASASSIYGSRAAFGVILVTTKKGKIGKVSVNYNDNFRFTSPVTLPKTVDSYTFALVFNEASRNGNSSDIFRADQLLRIQDYMSGKITTAIIPNPNNPSQWGDGYAYGNDNIDYFKVVYANSAFSQEHNLSLTGGDAKTTYYLSGNYLGQKGLLALNQDLYSRYSVTAKISTKISDHVTANYTTRNVREQIQQPSALGGGLYESLARQGWPTLPLYDPNGFLFESPSFAAPLLNGGLYKHQQDLMVHQLQLVAEPIKGWKTFGEFNFRTMNYFDHTDYLQRYNHDVAGNAIIYSTGSSVNEKGYKEDYLESNIYSFYEKNIKNHYFKITLGAQTESFKYRDIYASRDGVIVPESPTINTTSGLSYTGLVIPPNVSGQYQKWGTAGYFGRINYSYDNKYLFEANLRYDASSRFREDKRWAYFPSFSAGWNVANEDFFKEHAKFLNTFKFRASYGSVGNQNTNLFYPTYIIMPVGTANGSWLVNGIQPNTAGAPRPVSTTLTWETVRTLNLGIDYGFLNNRLTGSFDWYNRKTLNMLGPAVELPVTFGIEVPPTNNTDLKTEGWELTVAWEDRTKGGLGYGFNLGLSDDQTTVTRYPNITGTTNTYIPGQKIGNIYGFTTIGIAKTEAEMDAHLASSSNGQSYFGSSWGAGDIMYADYNNDGKIDAGNGTIGNLGDRHVIGNTTPRYKIGFNMHFDYKGFDMSAFFQGVLKQDFWPGGTNIDNYYYWGITDNVYYSTVLEGEQLDYFRADPNNPLGQNLDAHFPRPVFGTNKNHNMQTAYLLNGAYLRLKNLQLGYSLSPSLTKRIGLQKLRVYVSGDNLFTLTKVPSQFDPETINGGAKDTPRARGNAYPLTKVISFGLNVTF
ncbi:SusC/RagA family protein [Sphingobacteriaceae bacterium GW460-11-11-14-LB5]|nr:SusC/RagA family protein [Sphingobacteriaceae bacterium GW460-11-11-14-LB5]